MYNKMNVRCDMSAFLKIALVVFACAMYLSLDATADCCNCHDGHYGCYDGTECTPCCGYGGCNIFCCNCDGGCRASQNYDQCVNYCNKLYTAGGPFDYDLGLCKDGCAKRFPANAEATDKLPAEEDKTNQLEGLRIFSIVDSDKNGMISTDEFNAFVEGKAALKPCGDPVAFEEMDKDSSGSLTFDEVDETGAAYVTENLKEAETAFYANNEGNENSASGEGYVAIVVKVMK